MRAYLFPGQGSQSVGMGRETYDQDQRVRDLFDRADDILGYSLTKIMFEGPDEELRATQNAQPALYLHSVALYQGIESPEPSMAAGHSLGEYSALAAAGAFSFEDGLRLVQIRANAMAEAGSARPGTMGAIIGLDDEQVQEICVRICDDDMIVVPANYNSEGQLVVSGTPDGVAAALEMAKEHGARMAKELNVSGPFHSPLMRAAEAPLAAGLAGVELKDASFPVYMNATATPVQEADTIRQLLLTQLTAPVLWTQTIRNMVRDGADEFIEVGAGTVLRKLVSRIAPDVKTGGIS